MQINMAEPLPPQPSNPGAAETMTAVKPQIVTIGETPIHLTEPVAIDGQTITSFTVLGKDHRTTSGGGSAVILTREPSRKKENRGELVVKENVNFDRMDEKNWDDIVGIRFRDEAGNAIDVPKEKLSLEQLGEPVTPDNLTASDVSEVQTQTTPPEAPASPESLQPNAPMETVPPEETVPLSTPPKDARTVLESLSGNDPSMITIVGLKAYETRALDLADRSMQRLVGENKNALGKIHDFVFTTVWKQSIGGIYFHEKARQYYLDMLKTSETPFAEDAIRLAERTATDLYNKKLADSNFLVRAGTQTVDWLKDKLGMRTTIQKLALTEIGRMKSAGEIRGLTTLEQEAKAVRARFGADMEKADKFVRKQLGEKLEILDPEKAEHQPLVEGIRNLLTQYATGDIADKADFDRKTQEFFRTTLNSVRPDIFAEAELYSSSLFEAAEVLRAKVSHEGGLANIDEAMSGMHIRLGLGNMGEVTSLEPTAVEKGIGKVRNVVEWLNKKHVVVPMLFNEATVGSAVAITLSAVKFFQTLPARALVPIGGGALAGGIFAGWREYGQLHKDYLTHLRERETGAKFTETQKRRQWFERLAPKQRSAAEITATLTALYDESGVLRTNLTQDELRTAMATIADVEARKAVSETGPKRIGLIQYSSREAIETERTALDLISSKTLSDLGSLSDVGDLLGGNTFPDFMEKLTVMQTRVLREGVGVLSTMEDPVNQTLNIVSQYAPEVALTKRRWPFASRTLTGDEKALGLDAIMEEFTKEARVEATKYGVKAGVIGAAVGMAVHEIGDIIANRAAIGEAMTKAKETINPDLAKPYEFAPTVDNAAKETIHLTYNDPAHSIKFDQTYKLPDQLTIDPHDITINGKQEQIYDAYIQHSDGHRIMLGDKLTYKDLESVMTNAGFRAEDGFAIGDDVPIHNTPIPELKLPDGGNVTTNLPDGWEWKYIGDRHSWTLIDTNRDTINQTVASGIQFSDRGELVNISDLNEQLTRQFPHGFVIDTQGPILYQAPVPTETIAEPGILPSEIAVPKELSGETMTINASEFSEGGVWDYFLNKTHNVSTANGMKNLFRLYTFHEHNENITFPEGSDHIGFFNNDEHLRPATLGALGEVREANYGRMPNDAIIKLPESIFGSRGIEQFSKLNDAGIARMNELITGGHIMGPDGTDHVIRGAGDAINYLHQFGSDEEKAQAIALKLGYWGEDRYLPTEKADLELLYKHLGATPSTPEINVPTGAPIVIEKTPIPTEPPIRELTIGVTRNEARVARIFADGDTVTIPYLAPESAGNVITPTEPAIPWTPRETAWYPMFIPYRSVLETATGNLAETVTPPAVRRDTLVSPFGMEEQFLDKTALFERSSPRLKENQAAKLNQQEEISWHLATLTPEEKQRVDSLAIDLPPVNPELRMAVIIPSSQIHGGSVYQRLAAYANQKNADGTPMDPKKVEYIVYDAHSTPAQAEPTDGSTPVEPVPSQIKLDVDQFVAEHPDIRVVYVNPLYTEEQPGGKIKRDATNLALHRIATLPTDAPEVMIAIDRGQTTTIEPAYVSSILDSFDMNPALDVAGGSYTMPAEAYTTYPMLFASQRAFEIFDGLVRHGENGGVPATYIGNIAIRSGTLAAVGGYNENAPFGEDAELGWMVRQVRGNAEALTTLPSMTATFDPKELSYAMLQEAGLADKSVSLSQNETYKDLPWQDMAKRLNDTVTQEQLASAFTAMYTSRYPTLKANHPERFDAYFRRTLDTLGVQYEIADGTVKITNTEQLASNMATPIDLEALAKAAAEEVVAATPKQEETPREHLETLAGESAETPGEPPAEKLESSISSPDLSSESTAKADIPTSAENPTRKAESLPTGVEDRMNYVLKESRDAQAAVQLTPGELMDYIKSSVDIAGSRITEGKIVIDGNTVKLNDMKADIRFNAAHIGEGNFSATLLTDPTKGLTVDHQSLKMKLPFMIKLVGGEGMLRKQLDDFNGLVLTHLNTRIDPAWKAERIDIVGEKLEVKFAKK